MMGLFVSFTNQSCTNLDEELFSQVLADDFFQNDAEFISALGSAYTSLYGYIDGRMLSVQEVASDAVAVPTRGQDWDDGGHWRRLHQHLYTPDDPEANNAWGFCYGGINACNRLLFQFEASGNADAATFISELKVLRAMYYFWLLDVFGNVPIVERFDVPADFAPPTSSRAEVFAFIEKEIKDNVGQLTKDVNLSTYARVHYYVGQALLAKLYLNAEVYTGTARWSEALAAVNEIVNSGIYDLEADYFDNFKTENDASRENIFVIPYDQVFAGGFNIDMRTLHYGSQATFNLTAQPWNGFCTVQEFYDSFDTTDLRQKMFIVGPQFAADGVTRITDSGAEAGDPDGPPLTFTPFINSLGPNTLRQAGARIGKYEFALGATENLSNDFPIFRYGDFVLMKAELLWRLNPGDAEALSLVNDIRARADQPPFAALDADNLLAERGREVAFETYRRQDLIRFGKYNDPWWEKNASDPTKNIFPIPRGQIDANKNLTQNPGY